MNEWVWCSQQMRKLTFRQSAVKSTRLTSSIKATWMFFNNRKWTAAWQLDPFHLHEINKCCQWTLTSSHWSMPNSFRMKWTSHWYFPYFPCIQYTEYIELWSLTCYQYDTHPGQNVQWQGGCTLLLVRYSTHADHLNLIHINLSSDVNPHSN